MRKLWLSLVGAVVLVVGAVLVLVSCTGGDGAPAPTGTRPSTPAGEDDGMTRAELQDSVFDGDVGSSDVLGSVEGKVPDRTKDIPGRIDVTEVLATENSTLVRFTLVNTQDTDPLLDLSAFNQSRPLARDIRDVAIVDTTGEQRYLPWIGTTGVEGDDRSLCTCATAPVQFSGIGQLLSATFPAIDPSAATVTVEVPGFPPVEDVPVTRP